MTTPRLAAQAIRDATARFAAQCRLAPPALWNTRPAPDDWSMGDVTEHVAMVDRRVLRRLETALAAHPLGGAPLGVTDAEIPYLFYRGDEPPDVAKPTGAWRSWEAAESGLRDEADALARWADTTRLDLRAHAIAHPVFGLMDGVQWLLFAAAHTERHRAQLIGLAHRLAG